MNKGLELALEKQEKYNYPLKDKCKHCKELKAFEIIKEHWTYNEKGLVQVKPITMENADSLKEVLL